MTEARDPDLFHDLCESAHDLIQSVSTDGRFLYVNQAWLDTLGYAREEMSGVMLWDVVHPDSMEHCRSEMLRVVSGQKAVNIEAVFRTKSGDSVHVQGNATCRFGPDGKPTATCGIFRDITQLRQAEEELDHLFTLSTDLLCVAGTDGYFKRINPAFEKILGYSPDQLLASPFIDFVHPDDRDDTLAQLQNLARGRLVVDFENRYRAADGSWRWLAWRATPLVGRGQVYAVARDVTDSRRSRDLLVRQAEDLERSNEDLEQFAYVASHDLMSPLRAVTRLANLIEEGLDGNDTAGAKKRLDELRVRVARMESLTGDLLGYSRAGRDETEVTRVNTRELVKDVAFLVGPPDGLKIRADGSLPELDTCRPPFEQVLRNLVGNAVKHHDRKTGVITVSAEEDGAFWRFRVADDGPGIAEKYRDRVFQMFQKLESGDRVPGHGIGLALVKKIVERYGGQVTLESGEKRGSVFTFTWPRDIKLAAPRD